MAGPDLNVIENLWAYVKRQLRTMTVTWENLEDTILEIWNNILTEIIENLYDSIPRRLEECIKRKGFITKY